MLTLIIPSYNHALYVVNCLEAICKTNIPGKRILVIDDGSVDGTVDKIKKFQCKNSSSPIELICKANSGLVSSLNMGLDMVATEFVYFVASDDIPIPSGLETAINQLIENPSASFCIGGAKNLFDDGSTTSAYDIAHNTFFSLPTEDFMRSIFLGFPSPVLLQSTVFRARALRSVGGWNKDIVLDDYSMFIKLFLKFPTRDLNFYFLPDSPVVFYRHHGENAYRNIDRQFSLVAQTLRTLSPEKIKNQAIGYRLAFYSAYAISSGQWRAVLSMIKNASMGSIFWGILRVPVIIFKRLGRAS